MIRQKNKKSKYGTFLRCENKDCELILIDLKNKLVISNCLIFHEGYTIINKNKKGKYFRPCNEYPKYKTVLNKL